MKHYAVRILMALFSIAFTLGAAMGCAEKKMSEQWCDELMDKPNKKWTEEDATLFARDCLYNDE